MTRIVPLVATAALLAGQARGDVPAVAVSRQLAEERRLEIGSIVQLAAEADGANARAFEVAAIYEPVPDPFRLTARRLEVRLHLPDLIELEGDARDPLAAESVSRVNLRLAAGEEEARFARELGAVLPGLVVTPTRVPDEEVDPFVVLERFHLAVASVTVIGSAAFLLALMVMRSEERRETAGILRLLGFSRPRILLEAFVEGLWVAAAGGLFGVALARALEWPFNRFFQWYYDTALVFLHVTPAIALRSVALAVPLGVLAGLVASWTLLRREIMALLRR